MTHKKLETLDQNKRKKVLNFLEKDTLFSIGNFRLTLTDWQRHLKTLKILEKYDFNSEALREALLTVDVATRTEIEDETLSQLREELRNSKGASLKKVQK